MVLFPSRHLYCSTSSCCPECISCLENGSCERHSFDGFSYFYFSQGMFFYEGPWDEAAELKDKVGGWEEEVEWGCTDVYSWCQPLTAQPCLSELQWLLATLGVIGPSLAFPPHGGECQDDYLPRGMEERKKKKHRQNFFPPHALCPSIWIDAWILVEGTGWG